MFTAFVRQSDHATQRLDTVPALLDAWQGREATVWIDLEAPTKEELDGLKRIIDVDEAALEDCLQGEQRPRIDDYEEYIFIVLYGAIGPEPDPGFDPRKLAVFCGRQFLVTVHREPLRTMRTFRQRGERFPGKLLADGVDDLLYQMIDMMVDNFVDMARRYEERLEELEEQSLIAGVDEHILEDVLVLRRDFLAVRRMAASQRELLAPLTSGEFDYVSEELGQRFAHVRDHLTEVVELIDAQRERLTGVRENYHTALAARSNDVMKTLTIFAAVLLPLSVVAGIYGMNLPVWPSPERASSFWIVLLTMLLMGGGLLLYFRRRRWL
jgi:magnesium transporter